MIHSFRQTLTTSTAIAAMLLAAMTPFERARAQVVGPMPVIDLPSEMHLLVSVQQQAQQILQLAQQIQNQKTNLQTYASQGLWTSLQQRLVNLQARISNAQKTNQITGGVADAQMSQMNQEMAMLQRLQNLANGSAGSVQAQQAQARLQSEIIAQLQEQRQLTLAQLKQAQIEADHASKRLHQPSQDPSTY